MAPKFKGKLNKQNEFLTVEGDEVAHNKINNDDTVNFEVAPMKRYYTRSTTSLPMEILNTGNIDVIRDYLKTAKLDPKSAEYHHLQERISVMQYLNQLEEYNNQKKPKSVGPMKKDKYGRNLLPGIVLDREQSSGNGCWSCALSLLLKARGVELPQEIIRRYRPEFLEGLGPKSPHQTDILNGNVVSEVFQFSELVGKVSPNTMVRKMSVGSFDDAATSADARNYIIDCLTRRNTPVAICKDNHWVTVVGISDDCNTVYISDSQQPGGTITYESIDTLTDASADDPLEIVWTEDLPVNRISKKPFVNNNDVIVDPVSGAVLPKADAFMTAPDTQTKGVFVSDGLTEVYIPAMIRDYSRDYKTQKAEFDEYKKTHKSQGEVIDEAQSRKFIADKKYNYIKDYTQYRAQVDVINDVNTALDASRRSELKKSKKYPDDVIDKMSSEELRKEFVSPDYDKKYQEEIDRAIEESLKTHQLEEKENEELKQAIDASRKEQKKKNDSEKGDEVKPDPLKIEDARSQKEIFDSVAKRFEEYRQEDAAQAEAYAKKREAIKKAKEAALKEEKTNKKEKKTDTEKQAKPRSQKEIFDSVAKRFDEYRRDDAAEAEALARKRELFKQAIAKKAAETAKKTEQAKLAAEMKIYEQFDARFTRIDESRELSPRMKNLGNNILAAQLELSAAFKGAGGRVNRDCVLAAAKLMTYVTLNKVCSMEETDDEIAAGLLKPESVEKCVQDMLMKRKGESKCYAERVADALCLNKEKKHILELDNKDVFKTMIKEIKEQKPLENNHDLDKNKEKDKIIEAKKKEVLTLKH